MSAKKYLSCHELWDLTQIRQVHISHLDTSCLSKNIKKPRQIVWHLMNRIIETPQCQNENCNNEVIWNQTSYRKFCSRKCMASSDSVNKKKQQTNLEKYAVTHPMHSDKTKNKIKQTNLENMELNMVFNLIKSKIKSDKRLWKSTRYKISHNAMKLRYKKSKH